MPRLRTIRQRRVGKPQTERCPARNGGYAAEDEALHAGVRAADAALARLEASGVLVLFSDAARPDEPDRRLDVLRAYAEMRRALGHHGHDIPASSLVAAGFELAEIAHFNEMIATGPSTEPGDRPVPSGPE